LRGSRFLTSLIALALAVVAVAASAAPAATPAAKVTNVAVVMHDFSFTLSKNTVPRGKVIFTVTNKGQVAHDFVIGALNKKTAVIDPDTTTKLTVVFTKPGKYLYLCSVGEHFFHGMKGYLTVK
jgi:plastocyanin